MRRLSTLATASVGVLTLAAATLGPTSSPGAAARQIPEASASAFAVTPITWGKCDGDSLRATKARCGFLKVPLDYAKPQGATIKLAVSRIKATAPKSKRQGVLISNPGGPGGSGLSLNAYLARALPKKVASTYDLIGFDPRGVGDSKPALSCIADYAKGPRPAYDPSLGQLPLRSPNESQWLKRSKKYADACAKKYGDLLPHLSTIDAVKDIETMRRALGAKKINYYGFSYGTYLGQVYATMYPTRTRRLIFDGVVDPRDIWYGAQLNQDRSFEVAIGEFWKWIATHDGVYHLGSSAAEVEDIYYDEQAKLAAHPQGVLGAAEFNDVFVGAGYYQGGWPDVAAAFSSFVKGNVKPMKAMFADSVEGDDNGFAMYIAVQCVDSAWPRDYGTWRQDGFDTADDAPFITWGNVWFNTPCIYWDAPQGTPVNVVGSRTPEVLLINATQDGATPYDGALEVRKRFQNAVLISEVGSTTHADSLNGNACIDKRIFRYLRDGQLSKRKAGGGADVNCKRSPLPKASASGSSVEAAATARSAD